MYAYQYVCPYLSRNMFPYLSINVGACDDDCLPPKDTSPHQNSASTSPSGTPLGFYKILLHL